MYVTNELNENDLYLIYGIKLKKKYVVFDNTKSKVRSIVYFDCNSTSELCIYEKIISKHSTSSKFLEQVRFFSATFLDKVLTEKYSLIGLDELYE